MYCLIFTANCPAFKDVFGRKSTNYLPNAPYARYVSVLQLDNPITQIFHRLLSFYTGEWLDEKECTKSRRGKKVQKICFLLLFIYRKVKFMPISYLQSDLKAGETEKLFAI